MNLYSKLYSELFGADKQSYRNFIRFLYSHRGIAYRRKRKVKAAKRCR